ncbi:MAG TPA: hypothetical protein PK760_01160 [Flavobacteriales bacterium]|nr:hypothetical protein [Flavobacteriales bacterium]
MAARRSRVLLWSLVSVVLCAIACRKDKECPVSNPSPADGRDKFVGQYKVYDTTGVYQYDMEIMKANDPGHDSLFVVNWGNRFDMYVRHEDGDLTDWLVIMPPFPALDHIGRRWSFSHEPDAAFHSGSLINDTLHMSYFISNIAFFSQDGVPFFEWSYREYGVKQ